LLRGASPADLPVQAPTKYETVLNLKTAKAIGFDVPPPMLVLNTSTAMREYVDNTLRARSLAFKAKYQCIQAQTQIAMAEAELGAVILPQSLVLAHKPSRTQALQIVEPELKRQIAIVTLRGRSLSPAADRLAQLIRELIAARPPLRAAP
jgi:DNA-binding transcriptional LysR family regulator